MRVCLGGQEIRTIGFEFFMVSRCFTVFHGVMLQEHVQAQMSLVLSTTLEMNQNFWRGMLNRRQNDYGFLYGLLGFFFDK